jgi:chemotaxis signal transduction protein
MSSTPRPAGKATGLATMGGEVRAEGATVQVVLFTVGKQRFVASGDEVKSIRPSPRTRPPGSPPSDVPVISLSEILGLSRDTSVDRRMLEVEYWGERIGLEVTTIAGIRDVELRTFHHLPPLVVRNCASTSVLGVVGTEIGWAVAVDLGALLAERGVELPEG